MASVITYDYEFSAIADLYTTEVVLRAAYRLTDRFYVFLLKGDAETIIAISRKAGTPHDLDPLGELSNTLIDEAIRERVRVETGPVREMLMRAALSGIPHE